MRFSQVLGSEVLHFQDLKDKETLACTHVASGVNPHSWPPPTPPLLKDLFCFEGRRQKGKCPFQLLQAFKSQAHHRMGAQNLFWANLSLMSSPPLLTFGPMKEGLLFKFVHCAQDLCCHSPWYCPLRNLIANSQGPNIIRWI